jgi:ABC-type transport system involved in multi-copper enzyme maturation permease subunit
MWILLKIDFKKYFYSRAFWVMLAVYFALLVLFFFGVEKFVNEAFKSAGKSSPVTIPAFSIYAFPYVWHNLAYLGGFLKIFLVLIVLYFVTHEFSNKTIRLNIMNGMSRTQFIISKLLFVILLSLFSAFVLFVSGFVLGFLHTEEITRAIVIQKAWFIPAYFLEVFTFGMLAMFLGFLIRKPILSIGALAIYYYIAEPILAAALPDKMAPYLPVEAMGNLIDVPNTALMQMFGVQFRDYVSVPDAITCIIYSVIFTLLIFLIYRKKDL